MVDPSMILREYGFDVLNIRDRTNVNFGRKIISSVEALTHTRNGKVQGFEFRSMDQELFNLKSIEKKRMMLSNPTVTTASSSIKAAFPELHDHLTTSLLSVGSYLKQEYDIEFKANDYTLLRNGDNGTGKQKMDVDDTSLCSCSTFKINK